MPYSTVNELPANVKQKLSPKRQRQFLYVWNSEYEKHKDESRAFASAWSTVQKSWSGKRIEKTEADYVKHPVNGARCGTCSMFREPDGCTLVKGSISPNGHCKFYDKETNMTKNASASDNFNFFLPLTKVEQNKDGSVTVAGYASTPALDLDGEIVSLDAVKTALPGYWEWRNIREMHQPSAVGVAKEANVDEKGLFLTAKITDREAAKKCLDGVYKGYSVGGRKLAKEGNVITKIDLIEISVVDRPANPECKIEVAKSAKATGSSAYLLKARFPKNPHAKALAKMAQAVEILAKDSNPPAARDGFSLPAKVEKTDAGEACEAHGVVGCKTCLDKREFSDKQRQRAASSGAALPDGSFPIENASDLMNARHAIGRAKDKSKARAHIKTRARALGIKLPDNWSKKLAKRLIAEAEISRFDLSKSAPPSFLTLGADKTVGGDPFTSIVLEGSVESGHELDVALLRKGGQKNLDKRMSAASTLVYCFDSLRQAQRDLMREADQEGGDKKDADLAKRLGNIASELAAVIGQKAEHEGQEALDLSDADDQGLNFNLETKMAKSNTNVTDPLAKMILDVVKAGRTPNRMQRLGIARANLKKARKAANDMENCIKAAHSMHKTAYLSKAAKKKNDGDADDFDHAGAMEKLQKAFNDLTSMKTFIKAANVQLKKAASRAGQRGQETTDSEAGFYEVPAGVKDLSSNDLATAGPGTKERGSEPTILGMEQPYPGKAAKKAGFVSAEHAAAIARAAAAEAKVEVLEKMPAGPVHGRRPVAFDITKLGAGQESDAKDLLKGVNVNALASEDENSRSSELGKVIGNMITAGKGRSVFDPAFHGTGGMN